MRKLIIDEEELADLLRDRWKLNCLEIGGVDNWEGYGEALSNYEADEYNNDELTKDYQVYEAD